MKLNSQVSKEIIETGALQAHIVFKFFIFLLAAFKAQMRVNQPARHQSLESALKAGAFCVNKPAKLTLAVPCSWWFQAG